MPYTICKTNTRWIKCNSPHYMKHFYRTHWECQRSNILRILTQLWRILSKKFCDYWHFLYLSGNPSSSMYQKSLRTGRSAKGSKFAIQYRSDRNKNCRQSIISKQIWPNYRILQVLCSLNETSYDVWGQHSYIFMYRLQKGQFSFSQICRQNHYLENGYHCITISLKRAVIQTTSGQPEK